MQHGDEHAWIGTIGEEQQSPWKPSPFVLTTHSPNTPQYPDFGTSKISFEPQQDGSTKIVCKYPISEHPLWIQMPNSHCSFQKGTNDTFVRCTFD